MPNGSQDEPGVEGVGEVRTLGERVNVRPVGAAPSRLRYDGPPVGVRASQGLRQFMSLLEVAGEDDMPGLYEKAIDLNGEEGDFALDYLALRWGSLNAIAAAEFSLGIDDPDQADRFLVAVLSAWPEHSIQQGFEWLASIDDDEKRMSSVETFLLRAIEADPVAASGYASQLAEGPRKAAIIASLVQVWARSDPEAAWAWVDQSLAGIIRIQALAVIGRSIARVDPQHAAMLLDSMPFGKDRDNFIREVAQSWIDTDVSQALAWLSGLDRIDHGIAVMALATGWAGVQPMEAVEFARSLPSDQRDGFLELVARRWAEDDPNAAMEWARDSQETLSSDVLQGMFDAWSARAPREASQHIESSGSEETQAMLAKAVARNWARNDPVATSSFATSLPEGSIRAEAVGRLMVQWSRSDPMEASRWLAGLEAGQAKDEGIVELAFATSESDPSSALQWTLEISNPLERAKWVKRIGQGWIQRQGDDARSEILEMGLSPEELGQLGLE